MKNYVWVFKTNIKSIEAINHIAEVLNIDAVIQWTVDTEDCDCVLRVVTTIPSPAILIQQISLIGYDCSELSD